jgi:iron complex outermembrane receptor protein
MLGLAVSLLITAQVYAEDTNAPTVLKPTVVTGSLIPTAETVGPTPVDVVSTVELERRAVKAPEQLSKILPSAIGGGNFGSSRGNGGDGSAAIALRGIPGGTLVLVNGRRIAPNAIFDGSTVDLNTIPLAAVERIEILKDGGSAIYGADAVAGVVNFILKKNYTGTEFNAYYGNTTDTDVGTQNYSFITGHADDVSSFLIGGSYFEQNALYSKDRDRSRADITNPANTSGTSNPGSFRVRNDARGGGTLYDPTRAPDDQLLVRISEDAVADQFGRYTAADYRPFTVTDRFPFPNYTPAIRPAERYYFFGNGERQLFGDALKFFAEGSYAHTYTYNQLAPTPFSSTFSPATIPATNFYNPFGIDLTPGTWSYRTVELGPRTDEIDVNAFRIVTGFRGDIPNTRLNWETAFLYARDERQERLGGDFSLNAAQQTMGRTDTNAFNPFGRQSITPGVLNEISEPLFTRADQEIWSVDARLGGEIWDLPAGPLGFAAGFAHQEDNLRYEPDFPQRSGDLVGFNSDQPLTADRQIYSFFLETRIPILGPDQGIPAFHSFELTLAGRYDHYNDFGEAKGRIGGTELPFNPKIALRWQPIDESLTLRASYSSSFRAPTFEDLYQAPSEDFPELRNPVRADVTDPNSPNYIPNFDSNLYPTFEQIRVLRSGNPDLQPETAKNYTAGFVYTPPYVKNLTISWDWYRIEQKGVPNSVDQLLLDQNFATGGPFNPNAAFANFIHFDPNPATNPGFTYDLIDSPTLNLSKRILEGFDVGARYDIPTDNWGTFSILANVSYVYRFDQQNTPDDSLSDRLGDFVDPSQGFGLGTIPRLKGNLGGIWAWRGLEFSATAYYIDSYKDDTVAIGFSRDVDSIITVDLQASYEVLDTPYEWLNRTKFTVGVVNVTDEEPPLVVGAFADNYDRDTHDLRQRFWYVQLTKKF